MRLQRVWWMTGNTGFVFHEWIGLQLCHQIRVTSLAYAQLRLGREALCDVAMAHDTLDIVDAMRPGFPYGIQPLMAVGTVFSGWNLLFMRLLLGVRRLDGGSQSEQNEQDRGEQTCAESVHVQDLLSRTLQYRTGGGRRAVMQITAHCNAIYRTRRDAAHCPVVFICSRSLGPHRLIPGEDPPG